MEKFTFKKLLDDMNFSVFLLAALGSLLALWLNSNYISLEVYERDRDILVLKMDSLEKEITNLKYITDKNSQEVEKLVDLIEKIVNETVSEKKKQWIAEQKKSQNSIIESKIAALESKIKSLTENRK